MRLLPILALSFSSCLFPSVVPEALNTEFKPSGELALHNRSAGFDAVRVRSPQCNLSKRTDGSWAGVLNDSPLDVSVTSTRVSGVDFTMTREQTDAHKLVITGQFQGRIYRFELSGEQALLRAPSTSFTLLGRRAEGGRTTYGSRGELELRGEAGGDDPPWPQIGFALMAMMN